MYMRQVHERMTLGATQLDAEVRFGRTSFGTGPVTTYHLTPEQLEEFNRKCPPDPTSKPVAPLCFPKPSAAPPTQESKTLCRRPPRGQ